MRGLAEYVQATVAVLGALGIIVALAVIWVTRPPDNDNDGSGLDM